MTIGLYTPLDEHFSDIAEVVHIFYPQAQVAAAPEGEADILHAYAQDAQWMVNTFAWGESSFRWSAAVRGDCWERKRRKKRALKQACYYMLRGRTGIAPPWGSLTGIRPTRLYYERLARGDTPDEAHELMLRLFDVQRSRAQLLEDTVRAQRGIIDAPHSAADIYVGIPFCTTRCTYCSFFTEAIGRGKKVAPYLEALHEEIRQAAAIAGEAGLLPRALYVGGGTPTSLEAGQLAELLQALVRLFPNAREFTVEAGRPDTITPEKLVAMKEAGVTRISINPQTMNDATLTRIGRAHTAWDTENAFMTAREMGFANINMDIIAALPEETERDFARTLEAVYAMAPDSLTVHTLARKHGSQLNELGFAPTPPEIAAEMVEMGQSCAERMGMRPYYLYRQKYVAGNLENVGYALPGCESLYNIDIMEETTSILAMGAGAISKRIFHGQARIERAPNVGDVGHYLSRLPEMIARKRRLWGLDGA